MIKDYMPWERNRDGSIKKPQELIEQFRYYYPDRLSEIPPDVMQAMRDFGVASVYDSIASVQPIDAPKIARKFKEAATELFVRNSVMALLEMSKN